MLYVRDIDWDVDGDGALAEELPQSVPIPDDVAQLGDDAISDYLSDTVGFCHFGYRLSTDSDL